VITVSRTASWDAVQDIPAPELDFVPNITAPIIELSAFNIGPNISYEEDHADVLELADAEIEVIESKPTLVNLTTREFLDGLAAPGQLAQTTWTAGEDLHGAQIPTPVLIAKGKQPGPTLCVTAAVHGDELNGIESVRQLMHTVNPEKLSGTLIGVPIVNLQGFQRHSRYLSDRRDLNRFFPGNPRGSSASRMAFGFFNDIITRCDGLVDLHTGSFHRTNLPQLRADLNNPEVLSLTKGFGATVILHSTGGEGTLRRAAVDAGIPAVTLEAGEPLRLQEDAVDHTVKALFTLLDTMQMYNKRSLWGNPEPTYYSSLWVRADQGGILMSNVKLGKRVKVGDLLGTVIDPISNEQVPINAPYQGRVIGMALNQFVMPGYATFHIATEAPLDDMPDADPDHEEGVDVAAAESMGIERSE
jgi:predicted deacylase